MTSQKYPEAKGFKRSFAPGSRGEYPQARPEPAKKAPTARTPLEMLIPTLRKEPVEERLASMQVIVEKAEKALARAKTVAEKAVIEQTVPKTITTYTRPPKFYEKNYPYIQTRPTTTKTIYVPPPTFTKYYPI